MHPLLRYKETKTSGFFSVNVYLRSMKHEFIEFDHPHQINDDARKILDEILTQPEAAQPKDLAALGYPVRCIKEKSGYIASCDCEFPVPELLIASARGGFTLGTEEDIPPKSVSKALKWVDICHKEVANVSAGLKLCERMAHRHSSEQEDALLPDIFNMVAWYFPDFIVTTCWKPWIDITCVSRSTVDGSTLPPELLIQMASNWRRESRNVPDLINSIRVQT